MSDTWYDSVKVAVICFARIFLVGSNSFIQSGKLFESLTKKGRQERGEGSFSMNISTISLIYLPIPWRSSTVSEFPTFRKGAFGHNKISKGTSIISGGRDQIQHCF